MTKSENKGRAEKKRVSLNDRVLRVDERDKNNFYLQGSKCECCRNVYFPQRMICPKCGRDDTVKPVPLSKNGKLYSFTVIRRQSLCPPGFSAPYSFGYVDLSEGARVLSLLEGELDLLVPGVEMELALRRVGEDQNGNEIVWYSFIPRSRS